jgi:hypothetical protein|tara:strand:+ start:789 stop:1079 length:291 start_codon:yes stop_codon:yes gene_type:complete
MLKIEKGIPLPSHRNSPSSVYKEECIQLLLKMNIGDSVLVKDRCRDTAKSWAIKANRIHRKKNSVEYQKGLYERPKPLVFKVATVEHKQQRIWRVG